MILRDYLPSREARGLGGPPEVGRFHLGRQGDYTMRLVEIARVAPAPKEGT